MVEIKLTGLLLEDLAGVTTALAQAEGNSRNDRPDCNDVYALKDMACEFSDGVMHYTVTIAPIDSKHVDRSEENGREQFDLFQELANFYK